MKFFFRVLAKLIGWKVLGEKPKDDQYVVIFAPHTSNWDVVLLLFLRTLLDLKPRFIGKHTLFKGPVGWFLTALGGSPVNRSSPKDIVDQIIQKFNDDPQFKLAIAPEGTRSKKDHWKTGFYRIAVAANVPIYLVYLDVKTRTMGLEKEPIMPSGDIEKDFELLREFYADKQGVIPECTSDVRVKKDTKSEKTN
ncbi:lysophospholipid acyltransferase family protein [Pleionea sp. CnH1-48]|uniref:lysophospholipid acyltransferase family protein n=1 Tax=Pleionea sp. CnH1-48 TaxID=2954494 RepID=UPI002096F1D6|nr:lysophospholipid acyltransferase family protein [Pleionea sp. CnH1-48]MCO7226074.1 lysophospholipid acyltransferase family protein [Pleionea sp. CnH1-48]